jgi:hypothetical protein
MIGGNATVAILASAACRRVYLDSNPLPIWRIGQRNANVGRTVCEHQHWHGHRRHAKQGECPSPRHTFRHFALTISTSCISPLAAGSPTLLASFDAPAARGTALLKASPNIGLPDASDAPEEGSKWKQPGQRWIVPRPGEHSSFPSKLSAQRPAVCDREGVRLFRPHPQGAKPVGLQLVSAHSTAIGSTANN